MGKPTKLSAIINPLADMIDLIMPPKCRLCGSTLLSNERHLCALCISRLPRTLYHNQSGNPMEMRFAGKFPFTRAAGHFFYAPDSSLSQLIQNFKYRNLPLLARRMGQIMGDDLNLSGFISDIDVIIPIPIHWTKRLRRGYNQTELIAEGISQVCHIPVSNDLYARRPHHTQTHLSHEQRLANTGGIFRLRHPEKYEGKHILLLDDVCTTGATLTSAADAICSALKIEITSSPSPLASRLSLLTLGVTF